MANAPTRLEAVYLHTTKTLPTLRERCQPLFHGPLAANQSEALSCPCHGFDKRSTLTLHELQVAPTRLFCGRLVTASCLLPAQVSEALPVARLPLHENAPEKWQFFASARGARWEVHLWRPYAFSPHGLCDSQVAFAQ